MQVKSGFAEINGTKLYYETAGSGMPVVFLHGFSIDARMWDEQFEFFSKYFKCIRYDMRGFGRSPVPENEYSHYDDLIALLECLEVNKPVVLIGLSMGGAIALNFYLAYPDKVKALVLADSALSGYEFKDFDTGYIYKTAETNGVNAANDLWLNHHIFDTLKTKPCVKDKLKKILGDYSGWHWANNNPVKPLNFNTIENLDKITIPLLIMVGEHDFKDFHDIAEFLEAKVKNSQLHIIKDAGHVSNMENPEEFNRLTLGFLKQI